MKAHILLIASLLVVPLSVTAQAPPTAPPPGGPPPGSSPGQETKEVRNKKMLSASQVVLDLAQKTKGKEALHKFAKSKGFNTKAAPAATFGETYEITKEGKSLKVRIAVADHKNTKGEAASLGSITMESAEGRETYDFVVLQKKGRFAEGEVQEFYAKDGRMVATTSWSSCLRAKMSGCAVTCGTALLTCTGTLSAYLACAGISCGGCLAWEIACCGCNCSWSCRWGVGCCRR